MSEENWWEQQHVQALAVGTAVAVGVSAYYATRSRVGTLPSNTTFKGKTIVITGANTGRGFTAAEQFSRLEGDVVLACRDANRASGAVNAIKQKYPEASIRYEIIDVSDLESIKTFATKIP
jgi:FlaA1/EpsC-like NDP-sugar epimerase